MTAPTYAVFGEPLSADDPGFADAIAAAHAEHHHPFCLCREAGVTMYIARFGKGYLVKRMPFTGKLHAPDCPSYEPPADWSGLGQVLGSAIQEDPVDGIVALKLGFSMSHAGSRPNVPTAAEPADSVVSDGTRLSLRGLLHYLWDQAELTHWHPGFAGKRNWATVRSHLLRAAASMFTNGVPLSSRLYVPEVFSVERRDEISARRVAQWTGLVAVPKVPRPLMLLIGEAKEIGAARYGFKALIKHVPDQPFALDEATHRRLRRRFDAELSWWGTAADLHLIAIATFGVNVGGLPAIEALSLMPATAHWLPVDDGFEHQLVERLVSEGRRFVKPLRYNLPVGQPLASAILTDAGEAPIALNVHRPGDSSRPESAARNQASRSLDWDWSVEEGAIPALPPRAEAVAHRRQSA